jgi:hypothetical protein
MKIGKVILFTLSLTMACTGIVTTSMGEILKQEPRMGALMEGEWVLVDDGSCPPGQIKEVIGGNHVKVGGTKHIERMRHCISKH